ncbi:hypothetical protein CDAR_376521 [Caerostris darwini]|uniref:Uncharacterized protein n=1 Tax=Caerostris darwini TaxID=1538125 RepID=A0AAV4UHS9_9ARAC|nr:hypothetical protein CDAR_376521 [Caerostris darwini]
MFVQTLCKWASCSFSILRISELSENCSPRLSASETPAAVANLMLFGEELELFSSSILDACGTQTRVDFSLQMPFISCARGKTLLDDILLSKMSNCKKSCKN